MKSEQTIISISIEVTDPERDVCLCGKVVALDKNSLVWIEFSNTRKYKVTVLFAVKDKKV